MPSFIGSRAALLTRPRLSVQDIANAVGLTPALALDAGASASYPGAGQTWADISGNARDFVRGAGSSASTDDPTFNGTEGQLSASEFWSFDGGDFFTKATENDAFFNGLHKDGSLSSGFALIYAQTPASGDVVFSTQSSTGGSAGVRVTINSSRQLFLGVGNGSGLQTLYTTTAVLNAGAWNVIGWSHDENGGAGASHLFINGALETFNGAVTSPSASNAASTAQIGTRGSGTGSFTNGVRLSVFSMFASARSPSQTGDLYQMLRGRVGI